MLENIKLLGHAGFKITGEKVIYIDPFKIEDDEKADIILITHEHFDHCSPEDIDKVKKDDTVIVCTEDVAPKIDGEKKIVKIGDKIEVMGVEIEAVAAYNIGKEFHPQGNKWVGYIVTVNGQRIYHAGDTDLIPEMDELAGKVDIALLPVSGTYVMTADEAVQAAQKIKPKIAVPMHWGGLVGTQDDAETFKKGLEGTGINVEILE